MSTQADDSYTTLAADPLSDANEWEYQILEFTTSANCSSLTNPTTKTQLFYVAQATAYADATLTVPQTSFNPGDTVYLVVQGVKKNDNDWDVTWIKPSGLIACKNTGGADRPDADGNGKLPEGSGKFLQYPPNTTASGDAWNRQSNYDSGGPCPALGAEAGQWEVELSKDAKKTVRLNAFTLVAAGTIVIVKDAVPNDAQDFEFNRSFGANFFLDDDSDGTLPNTATFSGITAGSYTVTELGPPAGWTLTGLVCNDPDNGSAVNLGTRTATIDLDAGETVTCTFTNKTHDLVVSKTDNIDPAKTNQLVTYTITVTNNGPSDASSVTVTDTLPANGVTFVSATPSQGGPCTKAGNVVTCPLGTIANGNSATVTIQVRYTTIGTKTNTVSASSTPPDFDTSNNLNQTETTEVTQSCPSVTFTTTTPSSVNFTAIGEKKLIIVSVTNRSGASIQVISFEPQVGEPFTVFSVLPALPRTIAKGGVQRFDVTVEGTAVATATRPYFYINANCGVAATASDPRLLVPLQLEKLQAEVRSGFLQLEVRGEGIESVQVQLFNLSGRKLIDQMSAGATLTVPLVNDEGQRLANGVYLYIVTVRGWDGQIIRSEIRKLAILR